jgi:Lipase (class 3)
VTNEQATFGAPRFGNTVLVRNIQNQENQRNGNLVSNNFRVTHLNDVVLNLPPIALGYDQTQPQFFIRTANNVAPRAADIVLSSRATNTVNNLALSLGAHSLYINAIDACGGAPLPPIFAEFVELYAGMQQNGTEPV